MLALVTVPWLVHVVVLPTVFRVGTRNSAERIQLAALTILFTLTAGALILGLGGFVFLFFALIGFAVVGAVRVSLSLPSLSEQMLICLDYFVWIGTATVVGTVVGLILHAFTEAPIRDSASSGLRRARTRSDVLGGAVAAFLAFSGIFVASRYGLFVRPVPNDELHAIAPQLPGVLIVGVFALLPHLVMRGYDLVGFDLQQTNSQ